MANKLFHELPEKNIADVQYPNSSPIILMQSLVSRNNNAIAKIPIHTPRIEPYSLTNSFQSLFLSSGFRHFSFRFFQFSKKPHVTFEQPSHDYISL